MKLSEYELQIVVTLIKDKGRCVEGECAECAIPKYLNKAYYDFKCDSPTAYEAAKDILILNKDFTESKNAK
jgi:hypothetical protein